MAKKLQRAINDNYDEKLLVNKDQFYSEEQSRAVDIYSVKKCVVEDNKKTYIELFKSSSQVQIVLYLRDYWYQLNGWEIPTDNPEWESAKKKYENKVNKNDSRRANKRSKNKE